MLRLSIIVGKSKRCRLLIFEASPECINIVAILFWRHDKLRYIDRRRA